jgi:hypothetical protein
MDSDDDFLIDDDEGIDTEIKDELYVKAKSASTTPSRPGPGSAQHAPSPGASAIPFSLPQSTTASGSQSPTQTAETGQQVSNPSNHGSGESVPSPTLLVAPKPLPTQSAARQPGSSGSQGQQPATTADVIKGLQEGGNAILKKLGDFFQAPSSYLPVGYAPSRSSQSEVNNDIFFMDTYAKFMEALQNADSMTFPVLDDFINDFNGQESLRFDGSDLIEKQERDYFGLKEKRMAKLEALMAEGKEASDVSDEEALAGIAEQHESRDKAVSDGEYQTKVLREHQSSRGQMFQNIVFCATNLFKKLLLWPGADDREIALIPECIEEYLIPHVQKKLYCPDRWTDWRFAQLVGSTQFIEPRALDIRTPIDANLINRCGALLVEVNFLPTPRKKLSAIAQACRYIMTYLADHPFNQAREIRQHMTQNASANLNGASPSSASSGTSHTQNPVATTSSDHPLSSGSDTANLETSANATGTETGNSSSTAVHSHSRTDEFLAVLIYVLIQTNPPNLLSNVAYLITCRSSSDSMLTDEGYFFAHVAIAVHYLCKLKESKSASKVDLEGGVILHEPEWMPMVLDKEARLLHLLPSLNTARAANEILEYKSTIRRLVLEISKRNNKRKADAAVLQSLIDANPSTNYSTEQQESYLQDPMNFFSEHRMWALQPEDFKTPAAVANLLAEYKRLLVTEYRRATNQ